MKLIYVNSTSSPAPKTLFQDVVKSIPNFVKTQKKEVELLLTDNKEIHALNKLYRQKDSPTDVLSFGFADGDSLGQIVISVERAKEQAKELGQPLKEELKFLFTHGLLHLLGFDHETQKDEKLMLKTAYKILGRKI
ncbi:MAG: rRNA maturation RNase YbeY [Candidatus Gracilibacteria bacterium]